MTTPAAKPPRFTLGLILTLVGGGLCIAGIFLGLAPLMNVYGEALTDPLKDSAVTAQQTSNSMLKGLFVGAIGVPIFLVGSVMTGNSLIQKLRRMSASNTMKK
ncbi:MAG: hypothetical protein ACREJO_00360 [Phycisphaerales bacterium]